MWNNSLAKIVKYLTTFDVKWNSPFTFAKQIFHSVAISHDEAIFHSPKANFVAPQFIQEITKNVQHKLNVFCRFRPKVEIISWSFSNTVWYCEYRGNTCDIVHLSCDFVRYREYHRIKCCTKFAPKLHQHSTLFCSINWNLRD